MKAAILFTLLFTMLFFFMPGTAVQAMDLASMKAIGNASSFEKEPESGITVTCNDKSQLRLQMLAPDLLRVRVSFTKELPKHDHSWAIAKTSWDKVDTKISESANEIVLESSELKVVLSRKPLKIAIFDAHTGKAINTDADPMKYDPEGSSVAAIKSLGFEEHFYGLGEKAAHLDKRHEKFQMWTNDSFGYSMGTDPLYQSIPFYIGLLMDEDAESSWKSRAYGIYFDNSYRSHFDFSTSDPERVSFAAEGGELNYYFFYGPSMKKVIGRYTELTGRMPLPPKWTLGHQQCRYSYANEEQVKNVVLRYQKEQIPLDALHLDIHYMDGYRNFTWDHERFPDPPGLMKWLSDKGVKGVTIIDAGIKYEPDGNYDVYNEGAEKNYFLKKSDGQLFTGKVWPGKSVFVDYTLEDAAKWWGDKHARLLDAGVSGIWNDMNEPADFDSRDGLKWKEVVNYDEGQYSKHAKMRNLFAFLECKATYEGLARLRPDQRPYVITRSGFAGIQRYATMWTGDSLSSWSSLALNLPMFASLGLSGQTFVGADCGGFAGRGNGELLTRWYQQAFLTPFFRNHHEVGSYDQEPWRFGKKYEDIIRKYVQLRYQLMPYLYTVLAEAHETGLPWFRPLILEYQNDYNAVNLDDEFMVGDSLLAAPVVKEGAVTRDLYLPEGIWYDYFTHEKFEGGKYYTVKAPLDTVPLFVKAGSVLATAKPVQHMELLKNSDLVYEVFPDKNGAAAGRLYEDDGVSQKYLKGECKHQKLSFKNGELSSSANDGQEKKIQAAALRVY